MGVEETRQSLAKLLGQLRGNLALTEEERRLLETIENTVPHISLGPLIRMVEIVERLHALTDVRNNPPPASPLSGSLWRQRYIHRIVP